MVNILREYLRVRDGKPQDYLFPNENGKMLTESGLQQAIEHYNKSRGVEEVEKDVRIHKGMALET
jgi:site-specific recombinase XerD